MQIRRAWDNISREGDKIIAAGADIDETLVTDRDYRCVLRRADEEEYGHLHEKQTRLVTSGSFVVKLATVTAKLRLATSLVFVDDVSANSIANEVVHWPTEDLR